MFSYAEYRNVITLVKQNLPIMDFSEVSDEVNSFCVLRHDIEFSIDRALEMARIEHEDLNVHSTYTVQLRNNTYNALSQKNIEAIQEIESMGHYIGLHQNPPMMGDDELVDYILKDIKTLEHYYGFEVDRFAFHRCGSNPTFIFDDYGHEGRTVRDAINSKLSDGTIKLVTHIGEDKGFVAANNKTFIGREGVIVNV